MFEGTEVEAENCGGSWTDIVLDCNDEPCQGDPGQILSVLFVLFFRNYFGTA